MAQPDAQRSELFERFKTEQIKTSGAMPQELTQRSRRFCAPDIERVSAKGRSGPRIWATCRLTATKTSDFIRACRTDAEDVERH